MKLPRLRRLFTALITMFSLLFAQLAVAAYACPDLVMTSMAAKVAQEAMPGCTDMDMAQPGLCQAHCDSGHQSLDTPASPPIAAFVPAGLVATLRALEAVTPADSNQTNQALYTRATSPPMAIRHCCFRI